MWVACFFFFNLGVNEPCGAISPGSKLLVRRGLAVIRLACTLCLLLRADRFGLTFAGLCYSQSFTFIYFGFWWMATRQRAVKTLIMRYLTTSPRLVGRVRYEAIEIALTSALFFLQVGLGGFELSQEDVENVHRRLASFAQTFNLVWVGIYVGRFVFVLTIYLFTFCLFIRSTQRPGGRRVVKRVRQGVPVHVLDTVRHWWW